MNEYVGIWKKNGIANINISARGNLSKNDLSKYLNKKNKREIYCKNNNYLSYGLK